MAQVVAHRGLRMEAPENTIPAISKALALPGLYGVEFDVELGDGLFVLHQETMTLNASRTALELAPRNFTTRNWVKDLKKEDMTALDAGSWMDPSFKDIRVPQLQDILSLDWSEKHCFLELKDPTYWFERDPLLPEAIVSKLIPYLDKKQEGLSIISFNPLILKEVLRKKIRCNRILALWLEWQDRIPEAIDAAKDCKASAISISDRALLLDPSCVAAIQAQGMQVHAYPITPTVGEAGYANWGADDRIASWKKLLHLGVDVILTDFSEELLEFLSTI